MDRETFFWAIMGFVIGMILVGGFFLITQDLKEKQEEVLISSMQNASALGQIQLLNNIWATGQVPLITQEGSITQVSFEQICEDLKNE